jgi:hypothetical protein
MTPERRKCAVREAQQRRSLLDNGSLKHVSAATDTLVEIRERCHEIDMRFVATDEHAIIVDEQLGVVNSFRFAPNYKRGTPRVEAVSNTSNVALRVVGRDEKGSLDSETVKYGHESENECAGVHQQQL